MPLLGLLVSVIGMETTDNTPIQYAERCPVRALSTTPFCDLHIRPSG
jgi:hypothetical protein